MIHNDQTEEKTSLTTIIWRAIKSFQNELDPSTDVIVCKNVNYKQCGEICIYIVHIYELSWDNFF